MPSSSIPLEAAEPVVVAACVIGVTRLGSSKARPRRITTLEVLRTSRIADPGEVDSLPASWAALGADDTIALLANALLTVELGLDPALTVMRRRRCPLPLSVAEAPVDGADDSLLVLPTC